MDAFYDPSWQLEKKVLPLPPRPPGQLLPSVKDVAKGLSEFFGEGFFEKLQREPAEDFETKVVGGDIGDVMPVESLGLHQDDAIRQFAGFLQIPWEEFRKRAVIEDMGDGNEEWVDFSQINEEIMFPAFSTLDQAFEMIKPYWFQGHLITDYEPECGCVLVYYARQLRPLTEMEKEHIENYGDLPNEVTVDVPLGSLEEGLLEWNPEMKRSKRPKKGKR